MRPSLDLRVLALCLSLGVAAGCGHTPTDPLAHGELYRPSSYRATHAPYGSFAVRHVKDARPSHEFGRTDYLNQTYRSGQLFQRPIPATFKRVVAAEMRDTGLFTLAPDAGGAHYLMDLSIRHFYARYDASVLAFALIVPSVAVEAEIELNVLLTDQDGRRFLEATYRQHDDAVSSAVAGLDSTAAELLNDLLSRVIAALVQDADTAIPRFWKELGLAVPAAPAEKRE
jgi:hypothetical protein